MFECFDKKGLFTYEVKDEYNGLGGDSYVDDMFEDCKKKNLI